MLRARHNGVNTVELRLSWNVLLPSQEESAASAADGFGALADWHHPFLITCVQIGDVFLSD
jgi:hypothetical protein